MAARRILYIGLVDKGISEPVINRFSYQVFSSPKKEEAEGFADDIISVPLKEGQKPSEALTDYINNFRPQYMRKWMESVFPSFISEKEPVYKETNKRPDFGTAKPS